LSTDIHFRDPFVADSQTQPADDGAFGQTFVLVLPTSNAEHFVETILNHTGIHVSESQGAIAIDHRGFELHFPRIKRRGQGLGQFFDSRRLQMNGGVHDLYASSVRELKPLDSVRVYRIKSRGVESSAVRSLWERYCERLVRLARQKLRNTARRVADNSCWS
jgi:hypothetical protein